MRWQMRFTLLLLIVTSLLALALAAQGVLLAAPTAQLTVAYNDAIPSSPDDPRWTNVPAVDVPLVAQAGVPPTLPKVSVASAQIRAVNDGKSIAVLVDWPDATRDAAATRPDQFRDAVALQFGIGDANPGVCMGAPGATANLWHWKADWQEDIDKGYQELPQSYPNFWRDQYPYVSGAPPYDVAKDFSSEEARAYMVGQAAGNALSQTVRKSPVEELLTAGFGTATSKSVQNVGGKGVWNNGQWQVMFTRALNVQDQDAPQFATGKTLSLAVAIWNGSNKEVGARKQASTFVTFDLSARGAGTAPTAPSQPAAAQGQALPVDNGTLVVIAVPVIGLVGFFAYRRWK